MKLYSGHPRHLVAVDCIIFGYDLLEKAIKLLLIKRSFEPAKGKWSLAGGFVREVYMEQSYTYGEIKRDPGARVISTTYSALIKIQDIDRKLKEQNSALWQSMTRLPHLIFDHRVMVDRALRELQMQIKVKPIGFELLPEKFTLVQLQDLYEAIYRRNIDKRNFRKKILSMNILEKLDEKERETSKRGAYYYKFNKEQYEIHKRQGFFFSLDVN
jgi:8-oxo-dGTP diphosphatase